MTVLELDEGTFDEMIKTTEKLIVVEFYLTSCPVCAAMEPLYELLSEELKQDALFVRVDAQSNLLLSSRFDVIGTPTFKFLCKNGLMGEYIGEMNETVFRNTIMDMLLHKAACAGQSKKTAYGTDGYG